MNIYQKFSYEAYMDRALNGKGHEGVRRSSRDSDAHAARWTGTKDWETAAKLAGEGWEEGRELVGKILTQIESEEEVVTQKCVWDVEGDFVDIGAYVSGEPECMMHWESQPEEKRVARILLNASVSAGVGTEAMRWKGACVLALIDRLQAQGIRCHVDMAYCCSNYSDGTYVSVVNLKLPEEPLHLDLMAFHLVNPSSFRRVFFSFVESEPLDVVRTFGFKAAGNYGTPKRIDKLIPQEDRYDLIVPELHLYRLEDGVKAVEEMFQTVCGVEKLTY